MKIQSKENDNRQRYENKLEKMPVKIHKSDRSMPILRVIDSLPSLLDVVTLRQNGGHQFADTAHLIT